jgi:hypothetical protein
MVELAFSREKAKKGEEGRKYFISRYLELRKGTIWQWLRPSIVIIYV